MTFFWTPTTLAITVVVLGFASVCCWISWRRSGYMRSMGILEVFRFALIALVLMTLNQPEITKEVKPEERPTLVVLHDTSGSMQTVDVVSETDDGTSVTSRVDAAAPAIDPASWQRVAEKMEVIFEPFSSRLANPGSGTDIDQALAYAVESHANLRGIVLLSDGDWNTGNAPNGVATDLRMRKIPVFAAGVGSESRLPDIELICSDAPTFGVIGKTMRIPFRIVSWLPGDRTVTLTLQGTRSESVSKVISVPGMGQVQDTIEWRPRDIGEFELSLDIPVDEAEAIATNNELKFPVTVKNEALRVLVVESFPRWEYRYLRNALERDPGVEVNCLLFHPTIDSVGGGRGYLEEFPDEKELFKYDVVFLGDVGVDAEQLSIENCEHIRQLVRNHAGGLVFLPGFRGKQSTLLTTQLEELYPVVPDKSAPRGVGQPRPARFALTESGRRSLLTRLEPDDNDNEAIWNGLPGFQWHAATLRSKIGSEVLAVHGSDSTRYGRIPVIATRTSGTGKVLFMGTDGAWRWRRGVEDLYHYRFWGQVVRWMAYQRNMSQGESMRLFYSPDRPEAGNVLTLNANVMSDTGEPLREGTVVVQIVSPSGQTDSVRLASVGEDSWGLFSGSFTPEEGGNYNLVTTCAETGARLETTVAVKGNEKEKTGQPARMDVLREIAEITRGELSNVSQLKDLVDRVAELPDPEPVVIRVRIWSHPAWGGALIFLLGAFWTGRKMAGLA